MPARAAGAVHDREDAVDMVGPAEEYGIGHRLRGPVVRKELGERDLSRPVDDEADVLAVPRWDGEQHRPAIELAELGLRHEQERLRSIRRARGGRHAERQEQAPRDDKAQANQAGLHGTSLLSMTTTHTAHRPRGPATWATLAGAHPRRCKNRAGRRRSAAATTIFPRKDAIVPQIGRASCRESR